MEFVIEIVRSQYQVSSWEIDFDSTTSETSRSSQCNVTSTQENFLVEILAREPKYRYQIIIIDEKAKNPVVVGASLNSEVVYKFSFAYGFYIGSKSLISLKKDSLNHWKVE